MKTTAELVRTIRTSTLVKWLMSDELRGKTLRAYGFVGEGIPMSRDEWNEYYKLHTRFENDIEDEIDRRTSVP